MFDAVVVVLAIFDVVVVVLEVVVLQTVVWVAVLGVVAGEVVEIAMAVVKAVLPPVVVVIEGKGSASGE